MAEVDDFLGSALPALRDADILARVDTGRPRLPGWHQH